LALSELPASDRGVAAVVDLIAAPQNARDPWLPDAAAIAGVKQGPEVALALLRRQPAGPASRDSAYLAGIATTVRLMTYHFAAQENTAAVVALLAAAPQANPVIASGVLVGIAGTGEVAQGQRGRRGFPGGWPEDRPPVLSAGQREALVEAVRA